MKKVIIVLLTVWSYSLSGQSVQVSEIKNAITSKFNTVTLENKIVFIASELNGKMFEQEDLKELEKTASVYEFAKLKGGVKGIVCVLIVKDAAREIELNKLGIQKVYKLQEKDATKLNLENPVFINAQDEIQNHNSSSIKIFGTVNRLITR